MKDKFKIEVRFEKNRHYPEYGENSYSIEGHSIYVPYGRKSYFTSGSSAIEFVKNRITEEVLSQFDSVSITNWRGYSGVCEYLKRSTVKGNSLPIDKEFAELTLMI